MHLLSLRTLRVVLVSGLAGAGAIALSLVSHAQTAQASLTGTITAVWGDPSPGSAQPTRLAFRLTTDDGRTVDLVIPPGVLDAAGGVMSLNGRRVQVDGVLTPAGIGAAQVQISRPPTLVAGGTVQPAGLVSGAQPWVTVLCKFSDSPTTEPKTPAYFVNMLNSANPGLDHYWREVSYDTANITGSQVVGWFTLPQPRSYYVYDRNGDGAEDLDFTRSANDCTAVADSVVNYPSFVGINLVFNQYLDCCAWGGSQFFTLDGSSKLYRTTWMPSWSHTSGVFAHEMGHGFGLPHSSGPYGATYDSDWDPMSAASWGPAGAYGPIPVHTISYHKDILGWIPANRKYTAANGSSQTISIERIGLPVATDNYLMAQVPIAGSTTNFYTVEARRKAGYDSGIPGEAIVIHNVLLNRSTGSPANVVDGTLNNNPNDDGAMWTTGEAFVDAANGISIAVGTTNATSFSVTITVNVSPPITTLQPINRFHVTGQTAQFTAAASGSPAPSVQWQVSTDSGATFANVAGATSSTYSLVTALTDNGKQFRAVFTNANGTTPTNPASLIVRPATGPRYVPNDIDGDGRGELVVWRPSIGTWFSLTSSSSYNYAVSKTQQWGNQAAGDVPLMGDVDGDRISDLIVWRASTGTWYWLTSSSGFNPAAAVGKQWGNSSLGDVPFVADLDGDGKADLAVWRASTGTWYWLTSSSGYNYAAAGSKQWGSQGAGDVPKLGDIDGDGLSDLIVWRATTGTWYWLTSSTGYSYAAAGGKQWGSQAAGDTPLVADLDGDGKVELAVWRGPSGTWYWLTSASSYDYASAGVKQWGSQGAGDVPLLVDLDGDARAELIVWRGPSGTWYWLTSASGYNYATAGAKQWGSQGADDMPMVR